MENRSGSVVEAELTEATGTAERETTITLLKRTSSRTCSPAWSAGRAPAYRRPSARRSTRRARNAGHAAPALDLQTWKLARAAGPVVVIGTVGEDTRPPAQSTRSAQCESDDQWSPRARSATRGRFNGADAARKAALVAGSPGLGVAPLEELAGAPATAGGEPARLSDGATRGDFGPARVAQ